MVCWALHGSVYDVDRPMLEHPNGRCVMVPVFKNRWEAMTFMPMESGDVELRKLPLEVQAKILGRERFVLFSTHVSDLKRMVYLEENEVWGGIYRRRSAENIPMLWPEDRILARKAANDGDLDALRQLFETGMRRPPEAGELAAIYRALYPNISASQLVSRLQGIGLVELREDPELWTETWGPRRFIPLDRFRQIVSESLASGKL